MLARAERLDRQRAMQMALRKDGHGIGTAGDKLVIAPIPRPNAKIPHSCLDTVVERVRNINLADIGMRLKKGNEFARECTGPDNSDREPHRSVAPQFGRAANIHDTGFDYSGQDSRKPYPA